MERPNRILPNNSKNKLLEMYAIFSICYCRRKDIKGLVWPYAWPNIWFCLYIWIILMQLLESMLYGGRSVETRRDGIFWFWWLFLGWSWSRTFCNGKHGGEWVLWFLLECDALNVINPIDCSLVVPHWSINSVIEDIMESFLML